MSNLDRFIKAQENDYETALTKLKMVINKVIGSGIFSTTARFRIQLNVTIYGIKDEEVSYRLYESSSIA